MTCFYEIMNTNIINYIYLKINKGSAFDIYYLNFLLENDNDCLLF